MRSAMRIDAAIEYACLTVGKSRRDLLSGDFRAASQPAAKTNQRALIQPLNRLATFGELVDAMREADGGPCRLEKQMGVGE